jgi:hypothetical protein
MKKKQILNLVVDISVEYIKLTLNMHIQEKICSSYKVRKSKKLQTEEVINSNYHFWGKSDKNAINTKKFDLF